MGKEKHHYSEKRLQMSTNLRLTLVVDTTLSFDSDLSNSNKMVFNIDGSFNLRIYLTYHLVKILCVNIDYVFLISGCGVECSNGY